MSRIVDYLERSVSGVVRYFDANKVIVLLFGVLLAMWLIKNICVDKKAEKLLVYTLVMVVLLICPTAVVILVYQTAFYDYEWAWSMVPVTAVIAYGLVLLIEKKVPKERKVFFTILLIIVMCLCGNKGQFLKLSAEEQVAYENVEEIIQCLELMESEYDFVMWAPQNVMQEIRRQTGSIGLVYGRDMWDEKAGAYDYEAYSQELTNAYVWLENMVIYAEFASTLEKPAEQLKLFGEQYELDKDSQNSIKAVLQKGTNIVVLPNLVASHVADCFESVSHELEKTIEKSYTEDYTIYLLK